MRMRHEFYIQKAITANGPETPDRMMIQILDHYNQIVKYKRELGISHEQCALATLNRTTNETELAGIDQNDLVIGRTAVDFVVGMIHRNERGVPAIPFRILVQGTWVDGKSVIRRSGKAASEELAFSE